MKWLIFIGLVLMFNYGYAQSQFQLPSFSEGMRRAESQAREAKLRQLEMDQYKREAESREHIARANAYTSNLTLNKITAIRSGMSEEEYIIKQLDLILADPTFRRFPAEVQALVLEKVGSMAQNIADSAYRQGRRDAANAVARVYGLSNY